MTAEKLAKDLGYYVDGSNVMNKRGHLAPQYSGQGTRLFSFRHEDIIYTARLDKLTALFREKSPNLVTSESKIKRDMRILDYYYTAKSYASTCDKFKISKGCLHRIIKRNLTN